MADTVNAVDCCCAGVERAERELLQPRPRPGGLVFLAGGLPLRPLPPRLFSSKYPSPFTKFQVLCLGVPGGWHDTRSLWGLYEMYETLWFCLMSVSG